MVRVWNYILYISTTIMMMIGMALMVYSGLRIKRGMRSRSSAASSRRSSGSGHRLSSIVSDSNTLVGISPSLSRRSSAASINSMDSDFPSSLWSSRRNSANSIGTAVESSRYTRNRLSDLEFRSRSDDTLVPTRKELDSLNEMYNTLHHEGYNMRLEVLAHVNKGNMADPASVNAILVNSNRQAGLKEAIEHLSSRMRSTSA